MVFPNYVPNPGFAEDFLSSTEALKIVEPIANTAADAAKARAPRRLGHLIDSIEAEAGFDADGEATGRVNAHDFKAHWYEFGTRRHPAEPYLRPGMEDATGQPVRGGDK